MEQKEKDYEQELSRRSELILTIRSQMGNLENDYDLLKQEADKAPQFVLEGHTILHTELTSLVGKLHDVYRDIMSIGNEAYQIMDTMEEDRSNASESKDLDQTRNTHRPLAIVIRHIAASDLPVEAGSYQPLVTLQLDDVTVATQALPRGSNCIWDGLSLELPVSIDDLQRGFLSVQVWDWTADDEATLITAGQVSFPEDFITVKRGTEFEWPVLFCDNDGEPTGSVVLMVSVREREDMSGGGTGGKGQLSEISRMRMFEDKMSCTEAHDVDVENCVSTFEAHLMENMKTVKNTCIVSWNIYVKCSDSSFLLCTIVLTISFRDVLVPTRL